MKQPEQQGSYESITVRVSADWLATLDKWRNTQSVPPKRSDVIKLAVLQFIKSHPNK